MGHLRRNGFSVTSREEDLGFLPKGQSGTTFRSVGEEEGW